LSTTDLRSATDAAAALAGDLLRASVYYATGDANDLLRYLLQIIRCLELRSAVRCIAKGSRKKRSPCISWSTIPVLPLDILHDIFVAKQTLVAHNIAEKCDVCYSYF